MATATFVSDGRAMDYTPGSAVTAGDVIEQNALIGIAKKDIAANSLGALALDGIFDVTKKANDVASVGTAIYWDPTNVEATVTAGALTAMGRAVKAAEATDATVRVRLNHRLL